MEATVTFDLVSDVISATALIGGRHDGKFNQGKGAAFGRGRRGLAVDELLQRIVLPCQVAVQTRDGVGDHARAGHALHCGRFIDRGFLVLRQGRAYVDGKLPGQVEGLDQAGRAECVRVDRALQDFGFGGQEPGQQFGALGLGRCLARFRLALGDQRIGGGLVDFEVEAFLAASTSALVAAKAVLVAMFRLWLFAEKFSKQPQAA